MTLIHVSPYDKKLFYELFRRNFELKTFLRILSIITLFMMCSGIPLGFAASSATLVFSGDMSGYITQCPG